jgi:hypothetical protein
MVCYHLSNHNKVVDRVVILAKEAEIHHRVEDNHKALQSTNVGVNY